MLQVCLLWLQQAVRGINIILIPLSWHYKMPPVHLTHADLSVRLKKTLLKGSLYTLEEIQLMGQAINIAPQIVWFPFSNEARGEWPFADKDNLCTFEHQRSEFDCTTMFS